MTSLARALLYVTLAFGGATFVAPPAQAASTCAKKKKKKKAPKAEAAPKKITAKSLLKWKKSGMTDDEIVAKAQSSGYELTSKDKAALKKAKAKSLIAAFSGSSGAAEEEVEEVAATPVKKPIDLSEITAPEDIDFDSVPPPTGVPNQHVKQQQVAEKKKLDTSVRPAAPFEEEKKPATTLTASKKPAASTEKSQPAQQAASSSETPKKRVVYTAASQ